MKTLNRLVHAFLYMATFAVACVFYAGNYSSMTDFPGDIVIPEFMYYLLAFAIIGISLLMALAHAVGGGLMGTAAGGVGDGIKLGLMVGAAQSVGRLWPYLALIAIASFLFNEQAWWHTPVAMLLGLACFMVNKVSEFIWADSTK